MSGASGSSTTAGVTATTYPGRGPDLKLVATAKAIKGPGLAAAVAP